MLFSITNLIDFDIIFIDAYSSYSRKKYVLNKNLSDDKMSVGSDEYQRGAGMSYKEIEQRRNLEYTLDDQHKRQIEKIARPMFGKDDVKMTFIPKSKVTILIFKVS